MESNRLKQKIAEAMELREIKEKLNNDRSEKFIDHCEKIILFGKTQEFQHWLGELWGLCEWVQRLKSKSSNKPPKLDVIKDYFFGWDELENMFTNSLNILYEDKYKRKREDKSKDHENFIKFRKFCDDIAELLSKSKLTKSVLDNKVQQYLLNK